MNTGNAFQNILIWANNQPTVDFSPHAVRVGYGRAADRKHPTSKYRGYYSFPQCNLHPSGHPSRPILGFPPETETAVHPPASPPRHPHHPAPPPPSHTSHPPPTSPPACSPPRPPYPHPTYHL